MVSYLLFVCYSQYQEMETEVTQYNFKSEWNKTVKLNNSQWD